MFKATQNTLFGLLALFVFSIIHSSPSVAEQSVAETIRSQCGQELKKYCSSVTPGRARYAGCLLAHNDKLSEGCEDAFEAGLVQLYIILSAMNHIIDKCYADIDEHCDGVVVGGGRIQSCLKKNLEVLQPDCKASFVKIQEDLK
ncbi:MAG: cysteine rich repeat-containing protein [Hyphomicrobiales bacterium]